MTTYSHSRLTTFENCRLAYKFSYIDRIKREEDSIEAFLGSRFHEVMEKVYAERAFWKPSASDLQRYFNELWDKNFGEHVFVTRTDRTPENYREIGLKAIEDYHRRYSPFDDGRVLGIERRIEAALDETGKHKVMGYIDRLVEMEDGHFEIHDYKTSGSLPAQEKLDSDRQLALYEIAVRKLWPDVKMVDLVWHFVVFDKEMRSMRTADQLRELKKSTIALIDEVESADEFPPHETNLCRWCSYQDMCPLFAHKYHADVLPKNEYLKEDGVVLVNKYSTLDAKKRELTAEMKTIEEEQGKIKDAAIAFAEKGGIDRLFGSDNMLHIRDDIRIDYPKKGSENWVAFESGLKEVGVWEDVYNVNYSSVKSIAGKNNWLKNPPGLIAEYVNIEPTKTVRLSKRKDVEEE